MWQKNVTSSQNEVLPNNEVNTQRRSVRQIIHKIIFVHRKEIEDKWWHRLFRVILLVSTILVFGFFSYQFLIVNEDDLKAPLTLYAFNTEANWYEAPGVAKKCYTDRYGHLKCGDKYIALTYEDKKRLVDAFSNQLSELGISRYDSSSVVFSIQPNVSPDGNEEKSDGEILDELYRINAFDGLMAKVGAPVPLAIYYFIVFGILPPILLAFLWLLLLESIVYRTILYITFGKSKKS